MSILTLSYIVFGVVGSLAAVIYIVKKLHRKYFVELLELRTLLVRLPLFATEEKEAKKNPLEEINFTAQFLSALSNLKMPFALEMAVHAIGKEIYFYVAVPLRAIDSTIRQMHGLWSDASVEMVEDYNIFNRDGVSQGVFLKQKETYSLPIRTYEEAKIDTFQPIISAFSKIQEVGEGVALQILVKPAPKEFKKNAIKFIYQLKKGVKFEDALRSFDPSISMKDIKSALKGEQPDAGDQGAKQSFDQEAVQAIEKKLSKVIFSIDARIVVSAPTQERSDMLLNDIVGGFNQFQAPYRNGIVAVKPRNQKDFIFNYIFRKFDEKERMVFGTDEVVSIFHLPTSGTQIPNIKGIKSREAAPPTNIPKEGTLIGESIFRGERNPIYISDEDRRRHVYVVGQTGTGKSSLLVNMTISDIQQGKGVAVIDPHGDLIDTILGLIPAERAQDVIIFDPSDLQQPIGLNMIDYDVHRPEEKTFIVNEMQSIFNRLFSQETMGPMFEQYMRNALLLLMDNFANDPSTLMDVPRVFTDSEFRKAKLAACQNPAVKDFWEREAIMVGGEGSLQNMTPYITSKFNNFIANDYIRPIINQPHSAFRFREIMDGKKILLVNLSKGRIGDLNAGLLGMIIVGKILMAALSRVDTAEEKRTDFNLYIDEFQNFTTDSIATILSEARKYRLNLVLAHQFIAQLEEKIRDAVFGNVGSLLTFRIGVQDAEILAKQFAPTFTQKDLINIDNFNVYAKLLINGQTSQPFNMQTIPYARGNEALRDQLKQLSSTTYGTPRV
ncbi:MAG: type IV secretion system DNA-binding domain-containing protein [bacterium]|nr:type IV secretion system DNA-binding domain-containing protein [bacterium]